MIVFTLSTSSDREVSTLSFFMFTLCGFVSLCGFYGFVNLCTTLFTNIKLTCCSSHLFTVTCSNLHPLKHSNKETICLVFCTRSNAVVTYIVGIDRIVDSRGSQSSAMHDIVSACYNVLQ